MEEKIAKWITKFVGGSYIVLVLIGALVWLVFALSNGNTEILYSPTTIKFTLIGALYILSLILVGTLSGKSASRRVLSWLFSVIFHAGLLLYLGIVLGAGGVAFIFGMAETIILVLSFGGLSLCVKNIYYVKV